MRLLALVLALLTLPLEAAALELGARVRVTLLAREAPPVTGLVLAIPADSLVVTAEPDSTRAAIARLDIRKLEVSRGMHSNAGRFATIGGILTGVTFGLIVVNDLQSSEVTGGGVAVLGLGGAAIGWLLGAGVGALIGSGSKHEQWDDVRVKK